MNRPDWIIKNDGYFTFKSEWWCSRVSYGYQKGIPRVLKKLFFSKLSDAFRLFFFFKKAFISNFFSETSKSTCFEVRKHFKTLLDETTQRRFLLKKKVKSFFPVEKVTQSKKQSQSQHLVNLFSLSQHIVAFASRKWEKKKGCKMRYRIFPTYFRLWGSQCLSSFFKTNLREGCKNAQSFCPQILCVFMYKYLCVDDLWTFQ